MYCWQRKKNWFQTEDNCSLNSYFYFISFNVFNKTQKIIIINYELLIIFNKLYNLFMKAIKKKVEAKK